MRSLRCVRFAFTVFLRIPAGIAIGRTTDGTARHVREAAQLMRSEARVFPQSGTSAESEADPLVTHEPEGVFPQSGASAEIEADPLVTRELGAGEVERVLDEYRNMSTDDIMHQVDTLSDLASSIEHANRAPSRDLPIKFIKLHANANASKHDEAATYYQGWEYNGNNQTLGWLQKEDRPFPASVEEQRDRRPIKLVIGVISITFHTAVHNAHRTTWMQEQGVCNVTDRTKNDCHVFPFLVFGNVTDPSIEQAHDTVVLSNVPEPENTEGLSGFNGEGGRRNKGHSERMFLMGQFKTPAWFEFALNAYPWATHYVKMDADTFPYIGAIYNDLARMPLRHGVGEQEPPILYGIAGGNGLRVAGEGGHVAGCMAASASCRDTMMGEFYLMSYQTADCFVKVAHRKTHVLDADRQGHAISNTSWPADFFGTGEDRVAGRYLFDAEMTMNFCPPILRISVHHRWVHPV